MKAIIRLDVPEWQIWQQVDVFFPDTMCKHAVCEKEPEPVPPQIERSGGGLTWWNICGNCKTAINPNDKFCHECGRPIRWE